MGFFWQVVQQRGKPIKKAERVEKIAYVGNLSLIYVYREFNDTEEEFNKYYEFDEEFFDYESVGESGPLSVEGAKKEGMPVPFSYDYPIIYVYEFTSVSLDYTSPLFYSIDKEKVKQFLEK